MGAADRPARRNRQPDRSHDAVRGGAERVEAQGPLVTDAARTFRFVQWEFAGAPGPAPGRYVVRRYAGDVVREVVVVADGEAPRRLAARRATATGAVPVTRVTVIDASPGGDPRAADWQARARVTVARFLAAHRIAAADPGAPDADRALVVRAGTGTGAQLAKGEFEEATELPAPEPPRRLSRRSRGRPAERLAALLAARDVALACEELVLRARADLTAERYREAALQLEAALSAARSELQGWVELGDMERRLNELGEHAPAVAEAAAAAREGRLDAAGVDALGVALERLEAALRARAIYAAGE